MTMIRNFGTRLVSIDCTFFVPISNTSHEEVFRLQRGLDGKEQSAVGKLQ